MSTTGRLHGKRCLITGAASGVGRAAAHVFAAEGASLALVDIDGAGLKATAAEVKPLSGGIFVAVADISDEAQISAAITEANEALGGLDVVVANAGIQLHGRDAAVHLLDKAVWDQTIAVNLTGTFLTCKHGIRMLLDRGGGSVVITGSPTGLRGGSKNYDAYSASKAGVFGLMRIMTTEYGPLGIRVNAVVPGFTDTPLIRGHVSAEREAEIVAATPLGRAGQPEESARVMAFLASDEASFVSGGVFTCDGGRLAT